MPGRCLNTCQVDAQGSERESDYISRAGQQTRLLRPFSSPKFLIHHSVVGFHDSYMGTAAHFWLAHQLFL